MFKSEAQVTIGGQIDIRVGLPQVVVVNRTPRPQPVPRRQPRVIVTERIPNPQPIPRRPQRVIITERIPNPQPCDGVRGSLGLIMNQNNGPRFDYHVVDASVEYFGNNELDLVLHLNTGDVMVIAMVESNPNDFNFHYYCNPNGYNNTILGITLNNAPIALNSAAVSLQPRGHNGYTAVLNLHSTNNGDFNGTVNHIN